VSLERQERRRREEGCVGPEQLGALEGAAVDADAKVSFWMGRRMGEGEGEGRSRFADYEEGLLLGRSVHQDGHVVPQQTRKEHDDGERAKHLNT
jgi:hypothetical protein